MAEWCLQNKREILLELRKELLVEISLTHSVEEQSELKEQLISNLDKIHFHGNRAYGIVKSMILLGTT